MSSAGMALYVDGQQVAFNATYKSGMWFGTRNSYWRIGNDSLSGLPNRPTSNYLNGYIDEVATYPVALTAQQVQDHYALGATGVARTSCRRRPSPRRWTTLDLDVDGSTSSDPDGTIVSYAWDFGDGENEHRASPRRTATRPRAPTP